MNDASETDDTDADHVTHNFLHCSIDNEDDEDLQRTLIVARVPDAVFEEEDAQVIHVLALHERPCIYLINVGLGLQ